MNHRHSSLSSTQQYKCLIYHASLSAVRCGSANCILSITYNNKNNTNFIHYRGPNPSPFTIFCAITSPPCCFFNYNLVRQPLQNLRACFLCIAPSHFDEFFLTVQVLTHLSQSSRSPFCFVNYGGKSLTILPFPQNQGAIIHYYTATGLYSIIG